jgi:hypothetical protein
MVFLPKAAGAGRGMRPEASAAWMYLQEDSKIEQ